MDFTHLLDLDCLMLKPLDVERMLPFAVVLYIVTVGYRCHVYRGCQPCVYIKLAINSGCRPSRHLTLLLSNPTCSKYECAVP
jgi:hypothetical protein